MIALLFGLGFYLAFMLVTAIYVLAQAWVGERWGIAVLEVCVGLGPRLYRRTIRNWPFEIRLIPIGGYTKFKGLGPDDEVDQDQPGLAIHEVSVPARISVMLVGPLSSLALGLVLLALPIWAGAGGLKAVAPSQSMIDPCAVPGLAISNQPATWDTQTQLFRATAVEFIRRVVTFESLEEWGGFIGFLVTTAQVGALSPWSWIACIGILCLLNGLLNLVPLPILNGGHILLLLFDWATGVSIPEWVRLLLTYIGLAVVLVFLGRIIWIDLRWTWGVIFG